MANTIKSKCCSRCKEIKLVPEFHKSRSCKDGYHCQCKKCHKEYYQTHRAERLEYGQAHRVEHLQYCKKYRQAHRAELLQYSKEYHKKYNSTLQGHLRRIWHRMLHCCNNPNYKRYKDWGGRGIRVKFVCFNDFFDYVVKELKADPRGLTIDRIDNNGHYEPGNIRFVTHRENCQNRRRKNQRKSSTSMEK